MTKRKVPILSAGLFGVSIPAIGFTIVNSSWTFTPYPALIWIAFWSVCLVILIIVSRRELQRPAKLELPWPAAFAAEITLLAVVVAVVGGTIYGVGYLRYSRAKSEMRSSGLLLPERTNDVIDKTDKNGAILWEKAAEVKGVKELFGDEGKASFSSKDYEEARRYFRGEKGADPKAIGRLRRNRKDLAPVLETIFRIQHAPVFTWNRVKDVWFPHNWTLNASLSPFVSALALESLFLIQEKKYDQAESRLKQCLWFFEKKISAEDTTQILFAMYYSRHVHEPLLALIRNGNGSGIAADFGKLLVLEPVLRSLTLDLQSRPQQLINESILVQGGSATYLNGFDNENAPFLMTVLPWPVSLAVWPWSPWVASDATYLGMTMTRCLQQSPLDSRKCIQEFIHGPTASSWRVLDDTYFTEETHATNVYFNSAYHVGKMRVVLVAANSMDFKLKKGRWPVKVAELGLGKNGLDPFSQHPIQLKTKEGKLEISVLGRDLKEDTEESKKAEGRKGWDNDIVVRL